MGGCAGEDCADGNIVVEDYSICIQSLLQLPFVQPIYSVHYADATFSGGIVYSLTSCFSGCWQAYRSFAVVTKSVMICEGC